MGRLVGCLAARGPDRVALQKIHVFTWFSIGFHWFCKEIHKFQAKPTSITDISRQSGGVKKQIEAQLLGKILSGIDC